MRLFRTWDLLDLTPFLGVPNFTVFNITGTAGFDTNREESPYTHLGNKIYRRLSAHAFGLQHTVTAIYRAFYRRQVGTLSYTHFVPPRPNEVLAYEPGWDYTATRYSPSFRFPANTAALLFEGQYDADADHNPVLLRLYATIGFSPRNLREALKDDIAPTLIATVDLATPGASLSGTITSPSFRLWDHASSLAPVA